MQVGSTSCLKNYPSIGHRIESPLIRRWLILYVHVADAPHVIAAQGCMTDDTALSAQICMQKEEEASWAGNLAPSVLTCKGYQAGGGRD